MGCAVLQPPDDAEKIDLAHAASVVDCERFQRHEGLGDSGVKDQDVERPDELLGRGQRAFDVKLVFDIESNESAAATPAYLLAIVAAPADDNLGTLVGVGPCDRQPDAGS